MRKSWLEKYDELLSVDLTHDRQEVYLVPGHKNTGNIEAITVTVDSGAYRAVGAPQATAHFPMKPTESSKAGRNYSAANG